MECTLDGAIISFEIYSRELVGEYTSALLDCWF